MDSKNDLNVYMTRAEDETSCCGATTEKDKTSLGNESRKLATALGIMDFNEWAGMVIVALHIRIC